MPEYTLVAKNHQLEEELNNALGNTMFHNVHTFIGMYNSGFLNRSFDDTKNVLEHIKNTYKNVSVARGAIIIHSHEEYMANELAAEFSKWKGLSRLRRELRTEIEEGNLEHDTTLFLGKNGLIYRVEGDQIFTTRLVRVLKESWSAILNSSTISQYEDNEDNYNDDEYTLENPYETNDEENDDIEVEEDTTGQPLPEESSSRLFKANDVLNLDDSFIRDVYELTSR